MSRQLLLIAGEETASAFLWEGGQCRDRIDFPRNPPGQQAFGELLDAIGEVPLRIAFDCVDEEFQSETVPRVMGSARRELLQRRLQQTFLNPAYSVAIRQGGDPNTKHADQVLFAALTDAEIVDPWLTVIAERQLPLAGIYSVSLLSRQLHRWLGISDRYSLLLFRQSSGRLRQSYFADGKFRVSRLTRIADGDPATLRDRYVKEAEATRQFLASARLMPRNEPLHVHILHRPEFRPALESALNELPDIQLHLHDLSLLARKRSLRGKMKGQALDGALLAAHLLARANPRDGNYAASTQRATHRRYRLKHGLYRTCAVAGVGAVCLSGGYLYQAHRLTDAVADVARQYQQAILRLGEAQAGMNDSAVSPADMKAVVETLDELMQHQRRPRLALELLGQTLLPFQDVELAELDWRGRAWEGPLVQSTPTAGQSHLTLDAEFAPNAPGVDGANREWLRVRGEFVEFDGDFRAAHERLEELIAHLRALDDVIAVEVQETPLNIDPQQALTARLGAVLSRDQRPRAVFEFTLVLDRG